MDTSWSVKVKDEVGFPAFALLNRVTGQALRHGRAKKVPLGPYHPDDLNEAVLFTQSAEAVLPTQSADVRRGYQCIRPLNDIKINLKTKLEDDKHHCGLREGAEVLLFK